VIENCNNFSSWPLKNVAPLIPYFSDGGLFRPGLSHGQQSTWNIWPVKWKSECLCLCQRSHWCL